MLSKETTLRVRIRTDGSEASKREAKRLLDQYGAVLLCIAFDKSAEKELAQ